MRGKDRTYRTEAARKMGGTQKPTLSADAVISVLKKSRGMGYEVYRTRIECGCAIHNTRINKG